MLSEVRNIVVDGEVYYVLKDVFTQMGNSRGHKDLIARNNEVKGGRFFDPSLVKQLTVDSRVAHCTTYKGLETILNTSEKGRVWLNEARSNRNVEIGELKQKYLQLRHELRQNNIMTDVIDNVRSFLAQKDARWFIKEIDYLEKRIALAKRINQR